LRSGLAHTVPLGGPGTPEAIAEAALYFADPNASFVTGAVLTVDGGNTAMVHQY
jgi:3-oxoacyl-[acyl-carrier protein] reductase